jgi:hypothetical protein
MNIWIILKKFQDNTLPPISEFYSSLSNLFKIRNLENYTILFFEDFINKLESF